ncbi:helix-turn-helix transcriptional regulator [Mucilaginibacter sabulilitoris]|uniref:Helix-turn-helix transcriptional regulator n=1 Tax=Mucilaginibacter sabulilitoris TaxID=1173583 RepID=A0ABZ0TRW0_9SPHI|nr:helix-turn-helix transcriptional regulator [Mucilaginibacter sabulilitoris]WPU95637.1 helix-turn-helix transcriptional regulator [Mucilaginibacter sabulilitoris]
MTAPASPAFDCLTKDHLNSYVPIGRYETGKAKPAADMLSKLAKALDTTTDYL